MAIMTKTKPQPETIFDRIRALESECHDYVDALATAQKKTMEGVPLAVIKNVLCSRSGDNIFRAVLNLEGGL